jgi:hypothetical protein
MPQCADCQDTGYIDTGNNVLPCECPAGDTAIFNVAGEGEVSGAQLKRRGQITRFPTKLEDRTEFGHMFKFLGKSWLSTSGQKVEVVPPEVLGEPWLVVLRDQGNSSMELVGHDAEERAFCVAEVFTRQQLS